MNRPETARKRFEDGLNCAQAILSVYGPLFGLDETLGLKLSAGLIGGVGNLGHICGAVSGACLVLGLRFGHTVTSDKQTEQTTANRVQALIERFEKKYKTTRCRGLIRCDISDDKKMQEAVRSKAFVSCPDYIQSAAEILEELLND